MLVFEKSRPGRGCDLLPASDVEIYLPEEKIKESCRFIFLNFQKEN